MMITLEDLSDPPAAIGDGDWNDEGVVILKNFLPEELLMAYEECWIRENRGRPMGWPDPVPYTRHKELRDLLLYQPLCDEIEALIGEPPGLHLNLTGWVSTERNWHQDTYLNPPYVGDAYAAVWIALDTIHPDSGPFQYIPGSQRWRIITQEKVMAHLSPEERDHRWPKYSERLLTPIFEQMMEEGGIEPVSHLPDRGDVLIWNGRLLHRGSPANVPGMERRALIAHYSGIYHRPDMPDAKQSPWGGYYFPLQTDLSLYYGE
jgi:hypothetical protein